MCSRLVFLVNYKLGTLIVKVPEYWPIACEPVRSTASLTWLVANLPASPTAVIFAITTWVLFNVSPLFTPENDVMYPETFSTLSLQICTLVEGMVWAACKVVIFATSI